MAANLFERIEEKIRALNPAGYELTETTEEGWEFYFIRHALDQNRAVNVTTCQVKLFRALEGGLLGSASGEIAPTATDAEMEERLAMIYTQAGFIRNPAYELRKPATPAAAEEQPAVDPAAIARSFLTAVRSVPETPQADLNSYELFVRKITKRFRNSNGVEYTVTCPSSLLEVIVNARKEAHEVELYRLYYSGGCNEQQLTAEIRETLQYGIDRLSARPTPNLMQGDVVFSTDVAKEIYGFFLARTGAAMKVRKLSAWEKGAKITDRRSGDAVTVRAVKMIPNSAKNVPFDEEGAPIRDLVLIRDDVCENFWGGEQFSYYLAKAAGTDGENDSFIVHNVVVDGGAKSAAEIRTGDYLEVVEFSSFQVDPIGGDIAGEIRLGYLHRSGEVTIVTGGSVTGSMDEALADMAFSREQKQYNNYVIPAVTRLKNLRIAGCE